MHPPFYFLETYHMIDRCDPTIATWSSLGDNFVVKNVEKFASVSHSQGEIQSIQYWMFFRDPTLTRSILRTFSFTERTPLIF
jgi:hypothetical protein